MCENANLGQVNYTVGQVKLDVPNKPHPFNVMDSGGKHAYICDAIFPTFFQICDQFSVKMKFTCPATDQNNPTDQYD